MAASLPIKMRDHATGFLFACLLVASAFVVGCGSFLLPHYDPLTYQNLTDLKPEVALLYDTFADESLDTAKVAAIRLRLAQIFEYENGKGSANGATIRQIAEIQSEFATDVENRVTKGKWNNVQLEARKRDIAESFDIAISTEALKNRFR
jgi:hypothetical protein